MSKSTTATTSESIKNHNITIIFKSGKVSKITFKEELNSIINKFITSKELIIFDTDNSKVLVNTQEI